MQYVSDPGMGGMFVNFVRDIRMGLMVQVNDSQYDDKTLNPGSTNLDIC
jgi:hypothetical protein